jgi:hypothetical protein
VAIPSSWSRAREVSQVRKAGFRRLGRRGGRGRGHRKWTVWPGGRPELLLRHRPPSIAQGGKPIKSEERPLLLCVMEALARGAPQTRELDEDRKRGRPGRETLPRRPRQQSDRGAAGYRSCKGSGRPACARSERAPSSVVRPQRWPKGFPARDELAVVGLPAQTAPTRLRLAQDRACRRPISGLRNDSCTRGSAIPWG